MSSVNNGMTKYPLMGVVMVACDGVNRFLSFGPNHIFGIGEGRHLNVVYWSIQRSTSACMLDDLRSGCAGSCDIRILGSKWYISL